MLRDAASLEPKPRATTPSGENCWNRGRLTFGLSTSTSSPCCKTPGNPAKGLALPGPVKAKIGFPGDFPAAEEIGVLPPPRQEIAPLEPTVDEEWPGDPGERRGRLGQDQ